MAKNLKTNPQTRDWTPENDCCNRGSAAQAHSKGCMNNPKNARVGDEPVKSAPDKGKYDPIVKKAKEGSCTFRARGRCYVEGVLLEDADQTLVLSPAASYRQRKNKNLELTAGVIPVLPDGLKHPGKDAPFSERQEFNAFEMSFIESLDDSDPIVGAAPGGLRLIKQ